MLFTKSFDIIWQTYEGLQQAAVQRVKPDGSNLPERPNTDCFVVPPRNNDVRHT
jgi:hypothetical protein